MNTPIMTGSKNRLSLPLLKWFTKPLVAVEPQEVEAYRKVHPNLNILKLGKNDGGFSYMMNSLLKEAQRLGHDYMVFTDDDIYGVKAREKIGGKWKRICEEELQTAVNSCVDFCKKNDLAQLAVSFSGQSWGVKVPYQSGVGSWGMYFMRVKTALAVGGFDEKLPIFCDWDFSARLISKGFRTCRTNLLTFEHKMKSMAGGAEEIYKKKDTVKAAAEEVCRRYPHAAKVKFVEKHGLHEVRFNWKALAPG